MQISYTQNGYLVERGFFNRDELNLIREPVLEFHESWKQKNEQLYKDHAVNSAYLTGTEHLSEASRTRLFQFIGSSKIMTVVSAVLDGRAAFMNTQLFFNPVNQAQHNYWHRDPQYHLSVDEQKAALAGSDVVHVRIPLADEPGVELVPASHKQWDTEEELDVRLGRNGKSVHDPLSTGERVRLNAGDLLVFSGNMIHRGVYGMDRLSLDVLFCDPEPELVKFVDEDCLPGAAVIDSLENADAFRNTLATLRRATHCESSKP